LRLATAPLVVENEIGEHRKPTGSQQEIDRTVQEISDEIKGLQQ
jgi:hypothetical protein